MEQIVITHGERTAMWSQMQSNLAPAAAEARYSTFSRRPNSANLISV
jgi:hypothetical protein